MDPTPRILIVDDDPSVSRVLGALLAREGCDLVFACSGLEALDRVAASAPDLILLDVTMPGLDGFQVCQILKADERWQHIPILLVTGLGGKQDLVRGFDAGADDFVSKPVDGLELRARVRSLLRVKGLYDALGRQVETMEILHRAGLRMMQDLNMESIVNLLFRTSLELVPKADVCTLHLLANCVQRMLSFVVSFEGGSSTVHSTVGIEEIALQVIDRGQPIYVPDLTRSLPGLEPKLQRMRSLLLVPLADDQRERGVLGVYSPQVDAFEKYHQDALSILAHQAAVVMIKIRAFEEAELAREREKQAIQDLFGRYVSPPVVARLVEQGDELALGGRRQELTVLFADIRGFTGLSEKLDPELLIGILNRYLALAVESILAQEGTLDKFMGDAVMALFNAPLLQPDHTLRAVRAALAMQQAIAEYNAQAGGQEALSFGIGIHAGYAVVGNVGTMQQMNYTAIGDTVNLAKRLQEEARGGQIVLSEAAYQAIRQNVRVQDLGLWTVKGRMARVHVYELLGLAEGEGKTADMT